MIRQLAMSLLLASTASCKTGGSTSAVKDDNSTGQGGQGTPSPGAGNHSILYCHGLFGTGLAFRPSLIAKDGVLHLYIPVLNDLGITKATAFDGDVTEDDSAAGTSDNLTVGPSKTQTVTIQQQYVPVDGSSFKMTIYQELWNSGPMHYAKAENMAVPGPWPGACNFTP